MNKIITILLLLTILWPGEGFSQRREKKKKHKAEVTAETTYNSEEITNIFIDATTAKLLGETTKAIGLFESCLEKKSQSHSLNV